MATVPEGIVLKRHRDLEGPGYGLTGRRISMGVVGLLLVLALLNVFGQRPHGTKVTSGPQSSSSMRRRTSGPACSSRRASRSVRTATSSTRSSSFHPAGARACR